MPDWDDDMIAWIDLETTGLAAKRDHILEAACVVTDDDLREAARFERVLHHVHAASLADVEDRGAAGARTNIDPYVIEMHQKNGLWRESAASTQYVRATSHALAAFIAQHAARAGDGSRPQLGGSSVHFDRSFLSEYMPEVERELHHRHLDASVLNELARRTWPDVYEKRPRGDAEPAHRAMPDVLASIETARYYRTALAPTTDLKARLCAWLWGADWSKGFTVDDVIDAIQRGEPWVVPGSVSP